MAAGFDASQQCQVAVAGCRDGPLPASSPFTTTRPCGPKHTISRPFGPQARA